MKILIIQEAGRHKQNANFRESLSLKRAFEHNNHIAEVWGLNHENYHIIPDWESYNLIINVENYDQSGWVPNLSKVQTKKFLWSIDAHCKGLQSYLNTANEGNYDLILQSTPEFMTHNSIWFPNAYDDELIKPLHFDKIYDVGFCGNINNRGESIRIITEKFDFILHEMVIGNSMVEAINSYKIHFNANISIDINYRNFETIGCGTCLLTSHNQHYNKLGFIDKVNCLIYQDVDDMISKIEMTLLNDEFRKNIETNALILAQQHTYKKRIKIIEELI